MRPNILLITPHFFKDLRYGTHFLTAVARAHALAVAGCNVFIVLPSTNTVKDYKPTDLKNWHKDLIPIQVDMVRDQSTGALTHSKELLNVLHTRNTKHPYDAVFNFCTASSLGIQKQLCDAGYSGVNIPVISWIDIAASYDEWGRNPVGHREWYRYWEVLESMSPLAGCTLIDNPYDFQMLRRQMRKILSPAYCRVAERRLHLVWGSVPPVVKLFEHKRPARGRPFVLFIPGAFGHGREQLGHQVEVVVKAMRKLYAMGKNVKLLVSTNSERDDWTDEQLKGTSKFIDVHRCPKHSEFRNFYKSAHIGINYRYVLDGLNLSWIEMMRSGKPVIWRKSKWLAPLIPNGSTSLMVDSAKVDDLVSMILYCMKNYGKVAKESYELGSIMSKRHSMSTWGSKAKEIILNTIAEFNPNFDNRTFKSVASAFGKAEKYIGDDFETAYKKISKETNGAPNFYSRAWVLKLFRRNGVDTKATNGVLRLIRLKR